MVKKELIDGELQKQIAKVKLSRKPFKVYTIQVEPDEGLEVLYLGSENTALINPNGFPWFNVRLDPLGNKMTQDQHHTIKDSGFDRFISILEHLFNKYGKEIKDMATIESHTTTDGKDCWLLSFNNPHFKIKDYKVKAGEDLINIGYNRNISAYMIMQLNDKIDSYKDVDAGQVIKIPNDYSPRMNLLIDKEQLVPVSIKVYFDNNLFEHYQFSDVTINPPLKDEEFSAEFEGYGF